MSFVGFRLRSRRPEWRLYPLPVGVPLPRAVVGVVAGNCHLFPLDGTSLSPPSVVAYWARAHPVPPLVLVTPPSCATPRTRSCSLPARFFVVAILSLAILRSSRSLTDASSPLPPHQRLSISGFRGYDPEQLPYRLVGWGVPASRRRRLASSLRRLALREVPSLALLSYR